ncbi:C40 family peptidase [Bifidobacterium sp.]|uniref:C40 family peptidase n=1 Tax=Bifidobacterium sp. TaxID=41200 RepID=UPI003D7CC6DA
MKSIKLFPLITVLAAASLAFVGVAPTAMAASDATRQEAVVATRSFPKTNAVRKNILAESTSTQVESGSDWGGVESLNVPQTKSQAEKDQEAADQKAQEEEQARAQAQAQAQSQAANRSESRSALSTGSATTSSATGIPAAPATATGQALAQYALQFQGYPYVAGGNQPSGWDCSGFVQWVFSQFGVSLPHYSGAQMSVGSPVGSIADAAPGDIIVNSQHAAIYIGNGMVINALNPAQGTQVTSLAVFTSSYVIRRVL